MQQPIDPDAFVDRPGETHQTYLGDGVYASCEGGYQIWLRTQQGHEIALDDYAIQALQRMVEKIGAES